MRSRLIFAVLLTIFFVFGFGLSSALGDSVVGWGNQVFGVDLSEGFVAISAGDRHSLGLKEDGSIVTWGNNEYGQCDVSLPNGGFVSIAAGGSRSLGLKANGTITVWGYGSEGTNTVPLPNEDFVAIASGDHHSLGLKADGSIVAWSLNSFGQCDVPYRMRILSP